MIPKLSDVIRGLSIPETTFEQMASQAGIPVPPGPMKTLANIMSQFENTVSRGELPSLPSSELPALPTFNFGDSNEIPEEKVNTTTEAAKTEGGIDV